MADTKAKAAGVKGDVKPTTKKKPVSAGTASSDKKPKTAGKTTSGKKEVKVTVNVDTLTTQLVDLAVRKEKAKSAGKGNVGKPRTYKTPADMEKVIDDYFDSLLVPLIVYDKQLKERVIVWRDAAKKIPFMEQVTPPTVLGLCERLGLSVQGLTQTYESKEGFVDVITRARSKIERYWVELLVNKDSQRGAEFYLRCKCKYITVDAEQSLAIQRDGLELQRKSLDLQEAKVKGIQDDVGKINDDIKTLKEIISTPAPNRKLGDYE